MNIVKKAGSGNFFPLSCLILFLGLFLLHMLALPLQNDDLRFAGILEETTLREFLVMRYSVWTSRLILETVIVLLTRGSIWAWRILDSALIVLGLYSVTELLELDKNWKNTAVIVLVFAFVPREVISSAGWVATTVNYLWPCILGLYALIPIRRYYRYLQGGGWKLCGWEYITFSLAALTAANQEQAAAILLGFYLVFGAYYWIEAGKRKKAGEKIKIPVLMILLLGIVVLSLIFIFLCPGNGLRNAYEQQIWFPDYVNYSMMEKAGMGFLSTMSYYVAGTGEQMILPLFITVLCFSLWDCRSRENLRQGNKAGISETAAVLMAGTVFFLGKPLRYVLERRGPLKNSLCYNLVNNRYMPRHALCGYTAGWVLAEALLFTGILAGVAALLFLLYGKGMKLAGSLLVLAAGFTSRFIMGFSSTVFSSGHRTTLFCTAALLLLTADMLCHMEEKRRKQCCILITALLLGISIYFECTVEIISSPV